MIAELFASAGLRVEGAVAWGAAVPEQRPGVYVVGLTDDQCSVSPGLAEAPLSSARCLELLRARPELLLDGRRPSADGLAERLARFWLPDEPAVYIGRAGQPLRKRVGQYYRTRLGAKRPHAGGWPLKTLVILDELWVHYAATPAFVAAEQAMLNAFAGRISSRARSALHDPERVAPFANLRTGADLIKRHGISGATGDLPAAAG